MGNVQSSTSQTNESYMVLCVECTMYNVEPYSFSISFETKYIGYDGNHISDFVVCVRLADQKLKPNGRTFPFGIETLQFTVFTQINRKGLNKNNNQ